MSKKSIVKELTLLLPLARENLSSYLSPILGQYGIRNADFLNLFVQEFNKLTSNEYAEDLEDSLEDSSSALLSDFDLVIPVHLVVFKGNRFEINLKTPTTGYLYSSTYKKFSRKLKDFSTLYKIVYLRHGYRNKQFHVVGNCSFFNNVSLKKEYYNFRKSIKTK